MNHSPAPPVPATRTLKTFSVLMRLVLWLLLAAWTSLALTWAGLHFWIVPRIDNWRPELERWATRAVGVPVKVGAIRADAGVGVHPALPGFLTGLAPELDLQDVQLLDPQGRTALRLPSVRATLSPRSVWRLGFHQVHIESPVLDVRRTAQGRIVVAGLDLSGAGPDDPAAADWFFDQPEFAIRNGTVRWTDELRGRPPLALSSLDLVLRNARRSHEFRLDATPPADWGQRLSLRGRLSEPLLALGQRAPGQPPWHNWSGELYAELPQADLARLRGPLDLSERGIEIQGGQGSLRIWADMARGRIGALTADLQLQALDARLGHDLPALAIDELQGRISADWGPDGWGLSSEDLRLRTRDGLTWPGGRLALRQRVQGDQAASTSLRADHIDLAALTAIATHLPLGSATHGWLARLQPAGQVRDLDASWQGAYPGVAAYRASGLVEGLHLAGEDSGQLSSHGPYPLPGRPGIRNATAELAFDQDGGRARLQVQDGALELPGVFEDSVLPLQRLQTEARWTVKGERIEVQLDRFSLANADAQGSGQLRWRTSDPQTASAGSRFPGVLDLTATLTRADATRVHRYLPLNLGEPVRHYLREAVRAGRAERVDFRLRGEIWDMPFNTPGTDGEFRIGAALREVDFDYVPAYLQPDGDRPWPGLRQVRGDLRIDRAALRLSGLQSGLQAAPSVRLGSATITIDDLAHTTTLVVQAHASGAADELLGFMRQSPLDAMTGGALAQARADGEADLAFRLRLPLYAVEQTRVDGTVQFAGNDLRISPAAPLLANTTGTLHFSDRGFSVPQARALLYGGELRFEGGMAPDAAGTPQIRFRGQGVATAEGLRGAGLGFVSQLFGHASGQAVYDAQLGFRAGVPELLVSSPLQGLALALPAPLEKAAADSLPLRLETRVLDIATGPDGERPLSDRLRVELGPVAQPLLALLYERDVSGPAPRVLRGSIGAGLGVGEVVTLPAAGVLAHAQLAQLDVPAWERIFSAADDADGAGPGYLPTRVALRTDRLDLEGRRFHRLVLGATQQTGGLWTANLVADEIDGHLAYRPPAAGQAGSLRARLTRLNLAPGNVQRVEQILQQPRSVPALDIVVDELTLGHRRLGHVEVEAVNHGDVPRLREWRLNRLRLSTPEARLSATGHWAAAGSEPHRTALNFRLDIDDAGQLLTRFGREGTVRGGKGRIEGQIGWMGSPLSLDHASLSGQVGIDIERGQFLKVEPGAAKLLGVLSLQSLPRRLRLDFRDVFSEGFAFDHVRGDARIDQGVLRTRNLQMNGVNAAVLMEGSADLARETQDLTVLVVPEVTAGTASLLATAVNPLVGLGTFLAQLVLRQPLQSANTQQFRITGSWADPQVEKIEAPLRR